MSLSTTYGHVFETMLCQHRYLSNKHIEIFTHVIRLFIEYK